MKIKSVDIKKFIFGVLLFSITGCKTPLTPQEIFDKYKNSVVLITTEYYYELDLGNGYKVWFTKIGEYYNTEEKANENRTVIQGTGFYISKDGHIATNRHVVSPEINTAMFLDNIENDCIRIISETKPYLEQLEREITFWSTGPYWLHTKEESDQMAVEKNNELQNLLKSIDYCDFQKSNAKVVIKSRIYITPNGSNLSEANSYQECTIYRVSSNDNVDLAVIQTNNRRTESENIFDYEISGKDPLKIQEDVYMISYNLGSSLGQTANGLSVQFNDGKVMQEIDNQKIVYTVPALQGSSGSPVLDKYGDLVAINFAGIKNTQSFNFGIPVMYLKMLMNNIHF